ncbi:unnamed protein product [Somion occarium]|uniref:Uncharacterized protein n=1 Tax=Somion occarium TaxID=3059160 RepID=A0ABP1DV67_9APHY
MPKRPPTPPAPKEAEFLIKTFVRWLACCTGKENFVALYHKPASPNMVIIEIRCKFTNWDGLLGLHKWSQFLRDPGPDERQRESKIFYCVLPNGRQVQKEGWKKLDVKESWFLNWDPANDPRIVFPYPSTSYCDTPSENKTSRPLCRRLPVKLFPPSPSVQPPPVGSAKWLAMRDRDAALAKAKPSNGAWSKGAPAAMAQEKRNIKAPVPMRSGPAGGPWARGPPGLSPNLPPGLLNTNSAPIRSPVYSSSPSKDVADWSAVPPALSRGTSDASSDSGAQSLHRNIAELNIEDEFDMDDDNEEGLPVIYGAEEITNDQLPEEPQESLWGNYEAEGDPEPPPDEIVCTIHGTTCKKGICRQYASQAREVERTKRQEEREQERKAKEELRKRKGKNKDKSDAKSKFHMVTRPPPPHADAWRKPNDPISPAQTPASPDSATSPASDSVSPSSTSANPIPPPSARPARGRKMNSAGNVNTQSSPIVDKIRGAIRSEASSSNGGWGNVSATPWDSFPTTAGAKRPPSVADSGWGKVSEGPWGPATRPSKKGPASVSASSTGGWGKPAHGPWGNGSSRAPSSKGPPPSVVSSNNGDWGEVPKGPWGGSSKAPSVIDDDARTIAGDVQNAEDVDPWADEGPNKSWADQVQDELDDTRSVAASSTGG